MLTKTIKNLPDPNTLSKPVAPDKSGDLEFIHFRSLSKLTNARKWGRCVIGARLEVALHGNRKSYRRSIPFLTVTA